MRDIIRDIEELISQVNKAWDILNFDEIHKRIKELEELSFDPHFWDDHEQAKDISQEMSQLKEEVVLWEGLKKQAHDLLAVAKMDLEDKSVNMREDIEAQYNELYSAYQKAEFVLLLGEKYDKTDCIIAIHAGTGGTDAQDWAEILLRMLLRYAQKKNFSVEVIDKSLGGDAGIKSAVLKVHGKYAYGYLKSESGVHRLVRISPFDAEQMRHTSFALIEVLPLLEDVKEIEIDSKDLRIDTFRASGKGGQGVNTTDSAVRITHEPTGITVSCQNERSQLQNRETAMKILKSRLHQYYEAEKEEERERLRGEYNEAAWGNQIRSYVLHPYKMVKDTRTGYETQEVESILDGNLDEVIESYLRTEAIKEN